MAKDGKDDFEAVRTLVDALAPFDSSDQERIIRWAREKLNLGVSATPSGVSTLPPMPTMVSSSVPVSEPRSSRDIKSFIDEKDPKNDKQLATVVAYYYAFEVPEGQRKPSIGSQDLIDACRLAQKHRPKKPVQTLINAAYSGFLDKAEETGQYKLNAVGENLVAMALPGSTEGRRVIKRPSASFKKGKKTTKKKSK